MWSDLRLTLRWLRRSPGLAAVAVGTLALAIGATVATFAVVEQVLLRPLPLRDADRVVVIWPRERATPTTIGEVSYSTFRSWQQEARGFEQLAAMGSTTWSLVLQEGEPETVPIAAVSASFFPLAGANAALGRTLQSEDDRQGSARVAVLGHGAWQRRFGGDPAIVGRPLRFRDGVYTVVGVMPDGFDYPRGADMWVALVPQLEAASAQWKVPVLEEPGFGVLFVLGRLAPGVTIDAARATVSNLIARGVPEAFRPDMAALTPIDEHLFGSTRPALVAVALCVGLVLLIAGANAAVLLLVRGASRAHEAAARIALGASRWRLLRQSLVDAAVLSAAGGAAGAFLAYWTVTTLVALAPARIPRLESVRFDGRALAAAAIVTVAVALLVGVAPGLQTSARQLSAALSGVGARLTRSRRMRRGFAVAQVGLALVLLVCAGLVGRSFLNLLRIDVGFDPARVLTMDVQLPDAAAARHDGFYAALLERVRAMPGVVSAGAIFQRPLEYSGIGMDGSVLVEGQRTEVEFGDWEKNPRVNLESVTPGYFEAIGMPVVRGRGFTGADTATAPRVAIVGEALARRLWPGQDPLGRRLNAAGALPDAMPEWRWATVVGVVRDGRYRGLTDPRFDLYLAHAQSDLRVKHLMVRMMAGDPVRLAAAIRAEARRLDASALVENAARMEDLVRQAAPWRLSAATLGLLGVVALVLAALGVYATISQSVIERTHEIAIRVAIGAALARVAAMVIREGLWLALAGVAAGLAIAVPASRAVAGLLVGVRPLDPLTSVAMALLLVTASAAALSLPAWKAARTEPALALKQL